MRGDATPRPPETYIVVQQRLLAARQATSSEQAVPSLPVLLPSSRTRGGTVSAILCHGAWRHQGGRVQVENKTQSLLSNKPLLESAVHGTAFKEDSPLGLEEQLCSSVGWEILSTEMKQSHNLCEPVFHTDKALSPVSGCSLGSQTVCLYDWFFFNFYFFLLWK